MSVDLFLYNQSRKPISKLEIQQKLSVKFDMQNILTEENSDNVLSFDIKAKRKTFGKGGEGFDIHYQKDSGTYWAYTYNYKDKDHWNEFVYTVSEVARILGFLIEDPQHGSTDIDPEKFMLEQTRVNE